MAKSLGWLAYNPYSWLAGLVRGLGLLVAYGCYHSSAGLSPSEHRHLIVERLLPLGHAKPGGIFQNRFYGFDGLQNRLTSFDMSLMGRPYEMRYGHRSSVDGDKNERLSNSAA